jgi:RecB family endonuclease NucS
LGEFCDILAIDPNTNQLVIVELKNNEDRYIVQQLNRYYDNLINEKPWAEKIDYNQPVKLIAVAPTFHRHNFIDQKYNQLNYEFYTFDISQTENKIYFNLNTVTGNLIAQQMLFYTSDYTFDDSVALEPSRTLPSSPKTLLRTLDEHFPEKKEEILQLRAKILSFDIRMGETSTAVTQRYGLKKGNTDIYQSRLCAELYSCFYKGNFQGIKFSLWLPFPKGKIFSQRQYCQADKVLMKICMISYLHKKCWEEVLQISKIIVQRNPKPQVNSGESYSLNTYLWWYSQITGKKSHANSLDTLVDLALEEWIENINE